jgi:hypothetical protein
MNYINVGAVLVFVEGMDLEEAERIIEDLKKKGLVDSADVRQFEGTHGSPVWYVP